MEKYQRITISAVYAMLFALTVEAQEKEVQEEDQFAKIGNMQAGVRMHLLKENVPADLPEKYLPISNDKASAFKPFELMDTKKELETELLKMREEYKPFLANYAPSIERTRERSYLTSAAWRIESAEDEKDFNNVLEGKGAWEGGVKLLHFGEPLGRFLRQHKFPVLVLRNKTHFSQFLPITTSTFFCETIFQNCRIISLLF